MKVRLFVLLFLFAYKVKQKETCNSQSSTNKEGSTSVGSEKTLRDLLIVGGGAQAVALMAQFSRIRLKAKFLITIIETKAYFGPGLPYDPKGVTPQHVLNIPAGAVDITKLCRPVCADADFILWADQSPEIEEIKTVTNFQPFDQFEKTPQRRVVGEYLLQRFHTFVSRCRNMKYNIELLSGLSAVNVSRDRPGFIVDLSNGDSVRTYDLFLAMGHWFRGRVEGVKTYFSSPWPASDLEKIDPTNEDVAIFGSSQSGIDVVLTLAYKFGEFEDSTYKPYERYGNFKMSMYSRSGQLPGVSGVLNNPFAPAPVYMTPKRVNKKKRGGFVTLDALFDLMKDELIKLAETREVTLKINVSELKPEEFYEKIEATVVTRQEPEERLSDYINLARRSIFGSKSPIFEQNFFFGSRMFFNLNAKFLPAEDLIKFKKRVAPSLFKTGIPMPVRTAEVLLILLKSGHLTLEAVGEDNRLDAANDNSGVWLKYKNRTDGPPVQKFHRYFIDALGQSGDMENHPSSFVEALFREKLVRPLYVRFLDKTRGQEAFDKQTAAEKGRNKIIKKSGSYYYKADGVDMDMDKFRVIPEKKFSDGVIYASGPFTYGRFPIAQNLFVVIFGAEKAVNDMNKRRKFRTYS